MAKVLLIIAPKDFREDELFGIKEALESNGIKTEIASTTKEIAKGTSGREVKPDKSLKEVDPENYDYIIIIGGSGSLSLLHSKDIFRIIRNAKNIGAICLAPVILAVAGVLRDKEATVFETIDTLKAFKKNGCRYVEEDVVVDGTTITGNGPNATKEFARELVKLVKKVSKK